MKVPRVALVLTLVLAACAPTVPASPSISGPAPAATVNPSTPAPSTAVPIAEIEALLVAMAEAVLAGDPGAYLVLVDTSDPVFATEHTRWVDDWAGPHPVGAYAVDVAELQIAGDAATGVLTVTWQLEGDAEPREATFAAQFTSSPSGWRYAGEAWTNTEVPHFVIHVAPGREAATPAVTDSLTDVYEHATNALDYVPAADLEIKLYDDSPALVANTLLSLPDISGWNEPGEALKLHLSRESRSLPPVIAHELTHFICFDRAGTRRTRMPWWLDEGIATFVGTTLEVPDLVDEDRLAQVVAWAADDALTPWESMAVFEETPVELWQYVYPQGYAMVVFVTERFGAGRRNAWLAAMATEMDIDEATPAELGRTFDRLDREFRGWLADQR